MHLFFGSGVDGTSLSSSTVAIAAFEGRTRRDDVSASSSSSSVSFVTSRLLSSVFDDADDITDMSEAILVLGPQLCHYMLYILAIAAVLISATHAWQFRHRSLLLRIAQNALGWKDDSDFMPSFAAKDEATTTALAKRTGSGRDGYRDDRRDILSMLKHGALDDSTHVSSRSRREKALRDVDRLKAQLSGLVAENDRDTSSADMDVATIMATLRDNSRRTDTGGSSTTVECVVDEDTYARHRPSSHRRFSAREELLRRRGTSLASACRLLDESHAMHHRSSLPKSSSNPLHRRRLPPPLDPSSPRPPGSGGPPPHRSVSRPDRLKVM